MQKKQLLEGKIVLLELMLLGVMLVIVTEIAILYCSFYNCVCMRSHLSCLRLFATLWTVAHQAPLSMGLPRQEYWSGLPFPSAGDLPHPLIEPTSLTSPALAGEFFTTIATWEAPLRPYRSFQNIEYSSLHNAVGPCWLSF